MHDGGGAFDRLGMRENPAGTKEIPHLIPPSGICSTNPAKLRSAPVRARWEDASGVDALQARLGVLRQAQDEEKPSWHPENTLILSLSKDAQR